jgi:cytidylate kinase
VPRTLTVSIDGPTASGKTTLGVALARRLGGAFIDTGLTYRALAYSLTRTDLPAGDSWRSFIVHSPQTFESANDTTSSRAEAVYYHGREITEELWGFEVDNCLENVARNPQRRREITDYHSELVSLNETTIAAGRDVATTILIGANLHVFLNASFGVRRARRRAQHRSHPERPVVVGAVTRRDLDTLEQIRSKPNALVIDTTYLPIDAILGRTESRIGRDGKMYCE